jgi:hypothetical protein
MMSLLRGVLQDEDTAAWIDDVVLDTKQRQDRIAEWASPSGVVYSEAENVAVERCLGMFALFESSDGDTTQLQHSATIARSETKYDDATRLLLGRAEAEIRADPLEIILFILALDSRFVKSLDAANPTVVRAEVLATLNAHHTVFYGRYKARGIQDRTFLNSLVAKQVAEDPPTYVVAVAPIPNHDKICRKDEAGAVRGEGYRSFRCTEIEPGVSRMEYANSLDLKGWVPQIITDRIAVPEQMGVVSIYQQYFQHVRPLAKCTADDGHSVGLMLLELVNSKPKDLSPTICQFTSRTAMLRDCAFRHIDTFLARLLTFDTEGGSNEGPIVALDPSSVTEKQATTIGSWLGSNVLASRKSATLTQVLNSQPVLRTMVSQYAWFAPMLKVLTADQATVLRRRSITLRKFRQSVIHSVYPEMSISVPDVIESDASPVGVPMSNPNRADEAGGFSSVVRLFAPSTLYDSLYPHLPITPCGPVCALRLHYMP